MLTELVMWICIVFFGLAGVISLASLINLIKVETVYKKWLFRILMVEIIGIVVLFAADSFKLYNTPPKKLNEVLLDDQYRWYWQYSKNNWKTIVRFDKIKDDNYRFSGETLYLTKDNTDSPTIIKWQGKEPVYIPVGVETITIKAQRYWTEAAAIIDTTLKCEVNKKIDVNLSLKLGLALKGNISDSLSSESWGVVLIPGYRSQI